MKVIRIIVNWAWLITSPIWCPVVLLAAICRDWDMLKDNFLKGEGWMWD